MLHALAARDRYLMAVQFDAPRPEVPWSGAERLEIAAASRQLSREVATLTPMLAGWPSGSSEVMGLPRLADVALVAARTGTCAGAPADCVRDLAYANDALEQTIEGWTF